MSTAEDSSTRSSVRSDEVAVCGRGRGIRTIDLPAVFTTAEEREMLSLITTFDLSRNELEELTHLEALRALTRLDASYNHIYRFDGLPLRLTQLNLAHNRLEHLDYVGQLIHLRELDVSFNRLTSLAGLTPRVPLAVLKADDNRIERTLGLEGMQKLRVLSLNNNYIGDVDELLFLPTAPALKLLSLTGNPVTRVRRYRPTVSQLQPGLVSLDGAPLVREDDLREPSRLSSTAQNGRQEDEGAGKMNGRLFRTTAAATSSISAGLTRDSSHPHPLQQCFSSTHKDSENSTFENAKALTSQQRSFDTSVDHRTAAATQTAAAITDKPHLASFDDSGVTPRVEPPQPAARANSTNASSSKLPAAAAAAVARRDVANSVTRASTTHKTSKGVSPPKTAGVRARFLQHRQQQPQPQRTEKERSAPQRVAAAAPTDEVYPESPTPSSKASEEHDGERAADGDATTPVNLGSGQHTSRVTGNSSGYAALYATPSRQTPRSALANRNAHSNNNSIGTGRVGRPPSHSPASLQRSAALQELDSTAAQLYDSLVAKEQLHKECQALHQKVKHMEGQLSEARRVISQQLAELSQLRLERDALRQSEGAMTERLEKEKRVAKARAGHHTEEVRTLQSQYERMKTFYEAQLADTRRELSAERARLLRRPKNNSSNDNINRIDEPQREQKEENQSEVPMQVAKAKARNAAHCSARSSPQPEAAVSPSQRVSSPPTEQPAPDVLAAHNNNDATTDVAVDDVARQLTSWLCNTLNTSNDVTVSDSHAEEAHHQLQSKSKGTLNGTGERSVEYWKKDLERKPQQPPSSSITQSTAEGSDQPNAAVLAARKLLEVFVAHHVGHTAAHVETNAQVLPVTGEQPAENTATSVPAPATSLPPSPPLLFSLSGSVSHGAAAADAAAGATPSREERKASSASAGKFVRATGQNTENSNEDDTPDGTATMPGVVLPLPLSVVAAQCQHRPLSPPPPFLASHAASTPQPSLSAVGVATTYTEERHTSAEEKGKKSEEHSAAAVEQSLHEKCFTDVDEDDERTVILSAPPETVSAVSTTASTTTASATVMRDERVSAAKALLKGVAFMFDDAS